MIIKEQVPNMIDKEPQNITLSDAQKTFNAIYSQYSQDLGTTATMTAAIQSGIESIKEIPFGLQQTLGQELYSLGEAVDTVLPVKKVLPKILPANNKIYNANNDLTLGDRLKKVGEWQIETANRNLDTMRREYMNSAIDISEDELNSWTYKITSGGLQYGTMLGLGMINPNLAMSYMGALTLGSESIEGAEKYKERTGSIEGFAKESSKELALNVGNTAVQLFTEKFLGLPAYLKRFRSVKDFFKAGFRGALDEFGTENLQNLEDAIFDYMGNRFDEDETILTRMTGNFRNTLVAAMFNGGAGMSFAIYNRSKGIQDIKENLIAPDVPEYQKEELATKVYDKNIETLQNALTSELELSSELRAKYGERYDKLKQEIHNQIKDAGAYSNYTEDQIAQYVEATSKNFADQILAESTKRKVLMDDIVKSSQIVYDNGRLYLQGIKDKDVKKQKLNQLKTKIQKERKETSLLQFIRNNGGIRDDGGELKAMEASKQFIGLVNKNGVDVDRMGESLWQAGYFIERPTTSEVLDYIDDELRGNKHYPVSYVEQKGISQSENEKILDDSISEYADIMGYDIKNMSYEEKADIYEQMQKNLFASDEPYIEEYNIIEDFGDDFFQITDEMEKLDAIYPEYKGETININGVDKTVYNSNGERIAKSAEALQNFYKWFGDSKVVDEQGRPLVVYHGTNKEFEVFSKGLLGKTTQAESAKKGFFFTDDTEVADSYADYAAIYQPINELLEKQRQAEKEGNWDLFDKLTIEIEEKDREISQTPANQRGKKVYAVYLKANNVMEYDAKDEYFSDIGEDINKVLDKARKDKKDGVIIKNLKDQPNVYDEKSANHFVVFESNQIKSTQNRGTFSLESNNIYYQTIERPYSNKQLENLLDNPQENKEAILDVYENHLNKYNDILASRVRTVAMVDLGAGYKRTAQEEYEFKKDKKEKELSSLKLPKKITLNYLTNILKKNNIPVVRTYTANTGSQYITINLEDTPYENTFADSLVKLSIRNHRKHSSDYVKSDIDFMVDYDNKWQESLVELADKLNLKGQEITKARKYVDISKENVYKQITGLPKKKGDIKGSFDALTKSIKITDKADFSTYQHEFAHFWLDNIWDYMHSGLASPEYTKQWREVMRWLGVKDDEQYPTRKHHEKFARAYEKYLVNGEVPNSIMGEAFNKYENFIKEVYDSMRDVDERAGKKYEPLSVAMYDFFDSMVTGKLPMPEGMAEKMTVEQTREVVNKNTSEAKELVAEEQKILEENRANYNLKPAETSTKKSYLTSLEKTTGELVEAGTTTNEEQIKRATEFVNNNIDKAERIINGEELPPEGILTNAVFIAYNEYQKRLGNDDKRANALINQANQLRRLGQEIQSQTIAYNDIEKVANPEFWIRSIISNRIQTMADANKMTVSDVEKKIDSLIKSGYKDNMKPDDIVKKIGEELGITEFYQADYTELKSYKAVEKYVEERIGTSLTMEQARNIITRADNIGKDIENSSSVTGNPSVDFFVKLKELEDYANSLSPSSNLRVLVSVIGRGNLLFGVKSTNTNIISTSIHSIYRHILRRIRLMQNTDFISNEKKKAVYDYSWEAFKKTGYNVNNMQEDINTYLGESITQSQGKGKIRALGRFYENLIFKWSLGAADVYFKDRAFVDYLALKASKEGKTSEKANKLFDDAILIEPKTDDGKRLRQEAIEESLITTFQNKGFISEKALKARSSLDFGAGFGEIIAPFVKTNANIVEAGLEIGFGSVKAVASEIIRDIKAGKIQKPTQENINLMVNNGLGLVLAFLLTMNLDDEDYMPSYAMATSKDKQLAKQLNIPFNAIRIGNTWFSLDYLGALASPIVGVLQAKREEGFLNKIFGYSKSAGIQSLTLPAFGNIADIFENIKNSLRKTADDIIPDTVDSLIGQVYSRLTPAIISDIAKAFDDYDREAKDHRIMAKIPFVRERLEKKINLTSGKAEKIDNAIIDIFAGSRVKVQVRNKVADEFSRLNNAGYGVSLTDVTQRGLLSTVSEPYKKEIRERFAREYAKEVNKLINSPLYKRKSDEDKKESIDKVKRKIVDNLKKQYLKKAK